MRKMIEGNLLPFQEEKIRWNRYLLIKKLSLEEADKMVSEVSDKEIKEALFDIDDLKAPGPDGFSSDFFKKAWRVIGPDICKAVKEFFMSRKMLGELNATIISLILKVQTPNKLTDFRPIACCNVLYKCISKVLTNRIKPILGKLKRGPRRVAFKIDIQKAYDTVNWKFLEKILGGFGFHPSMVNWIMQCVSTNAFTLNVNGDKIGYFKGERGLGRPYFFIFVHFNHGSLSHGDVTSVKVIKKALDIFSACSGLVPNNSKSTVIFRSMKEEDKNAISFVLPFAIGKLPLIAAVLESIRVYWALVFLLPATIIKDINRLLKSFLWNQSEKTARKAKVAWSSICRPKDQSGLGLKNLQIWNNALLAKHVWNIAIKKDSLWVKWAHSVKLREKSIWDVKVNNEGSWGWKNLLEIRDQIKDNMIYKPDEWYEKFPLITTLALEFNGGSWFGILNVFQSTVSLYGLPYKIEDLKHLLFQCPFYKEVWNKAMDMTEVKVKEYEWEEIIQALIKAGQDKKTSSVDVFNRIIDVVKGKISGLLLRTAMQLRRWKANGRSVVKDFLRSPQKEEIKTFYV
ncbi:RNA-directed DNA polymerase, eukaryota, reverse transcriptase zinc-binding domain protein [Tanacetum coccineum]